MQANVGVRAATVLFVFRIFRLEGLSFPLSLLAQPDEMLKTFQGVERGVDDVRDRLANAASEAPEEEDPANDETFFITGGGQELGGQEQVDEDEGMLPDEMQLLAEENARVEYVPGGPRRHQPSAALAALKFALSHPLVEGDGGPAPHHLKVRGSKDARLRDEALHSAPYTLRGLGFSGRAPQTLGTSAPVPGVCEGTGEGLVEF